MSNASSFTTPIPVSSASEAPGSLIEARGVTKTYDTGRVQVQALRGIDLDVARGEMIAIMKLTITTTPK